MFSEGVVVAYETPVIMVHVGNPKGITGLANLAKKDMRVAMADQDTPEGQMIRAMLAKAGITEEDFSVRSQYEVNFDAAIVYRNAVSAKEKEEYEFVEIEPDYLIENPVFYSRPSLPSILNLLTNLPALCSRGECSIRLKFWLPTCKIRFLKTV